MADITTIIADILKTQDDAYATPEAIAANVGPSPTQQISTLQSQLASAEGQVTTLTEANATLQAKITAAQADAAKLTADLQ